MRKLLLVLFISIALISCRKEDELLINNNPITSIFLESIDRSGTDRLNTIVTLHWSGEDKDGYVVGYEISFDSLTWTFTDKQDSTFRFSINSNSDTADIKFYVRAIDNDQNKDLSPAFLKVPIKNTLPTISFDQNMIKADSVFSVFSLLWTATDLDGNETLDSVYLRINNSEWFAISKNYNFASFVPVNAETDGTTEAIVYGGVNAINLNKRIKGLIVGGANKIYIKVKDQSGAESALDSMSTFVLRKKTSDLLVLDAFNIATTPNADVVYKQAISEAYGAADFYDFYRLNKAYIPKYWNPTFRLFLNLYDKVFIYSDNSQSATAGGMILEDAASAFQNYLNNNGKMFIATDIANNASPNNFDKNSTLYQYTPVDSFQTFYAANQKATLPVDSLLIPNAVNAIGYPTLKVSNFSDAVDPFFIKQSALPLYTGQIRKTNGVIATRILAGKSTNFNNQTNMVFFSTDLFKLAGDGNNNAQADELKLLFQQVFNVEFNW